MKEATEENKLIHKCLETTQKVVLALELYSLGLSEQTKELREQTVGSCLAF